MEVTRVASLQELVGQSWKVWRVKTKSGSTYHLGLCHEPGRKMGILRGPPRADGTRVEIHDREPRLDSGTLLFELAPSKWVGHGLLFGTAETSRIVEVLAETDGEMITHVTGAALTLAPPPAPRAPLPKRPPYPASYVDDVEYAAQILRNVYQKKTLFDDLRKQPALLEPMRVALTECALMVQAMGRKL